MYARRKRDVEASTVQIKEDYISKWLLYFGTGKDALVSGADGRNMVIPGRGDFRGNTQEQFWECVEPLIENAVVDILQGSQRDIATFGSRFQAKHLEETRFLLRERLVRPIYDDMQTADQNLRGKNNPKKVLLRNIEDKLDKFDKFIKGQVDASQRLLNKNNKRGFTRYIWAFLLGAFLMFLLILFDKVMAPPAPGNNTSQPLSSGLEGETSLSVPEKNSPTNNIFNNFSQMFKAKAEKEKQNETGTAVFPGMSKDTNPNEGLNLNFGNSIQKLTPVPKTEKNTKAVTLPTPPTVAEKTTTEEAAKSEKATADKSNEISKEPKKKVDEIQTIHEESTNPFASLSQDNTSPATDDVPTASTPPTLPNPVTQPPDLDAGIGDAPAGLDMDLGLGDEPNPNDLDANIAEDVAAQEEKAASKENTQASTPAPNKAG